MKILRFNELHNLTGAQIKNLRKKKGLTQDQVVAKMQLAGIQIDQKAISRIENGSRVITDYELMCLAEILGTSIDQIIRDSMYSLDKDE